jgi:hypothetical protein
LKSLIFFGGWLIELPKPWRSPCFQRLGGKYGAYKRDIAVDYTISGKSRAGGGAVPRRGQARLARIARSAQPEISIEQLPKPIHGDERSVYWRGQRDDCRAGVRAVEYARAAECVLRPQL